MAFQSDLEHGPEVIRSRPEAQIKAVLQIKARILSDHQSAYLEDIIQKRKKGYKDFVPHSTSFAEEEVEDESCTVGIEEQRMESAGRLQTLSCVVTAQQKVYNNIMYMVKLSELDEANGPPSPQATECLSPGDDPASPSSSSRGPRGQRSVLPRPASAAAVCSTALGSRDVNAQIVAERFEYQQACQERFQEGHRAVLENKVKKHDDLYASLDAAELRHAKQTQDKLLEQKKKMLRTQQKHSDHERMLRELQRSQEKQATLLHAKCHPTAKKLARPVSSPGKLRGNTDKLASSKEVLEQPIHQHMLQSHAKFSGTLAKYQQFVADNERRMEAHWQNVAPGEIRRTKSKENDEKGKCRKVAFKAVVNQVTAAGRILRADSMKDMTAEDMTAVHLFADSIAESSVPDSLPERPSSPSAPYAMRLERCRLFEQELEAARNAKRADDQAKLAAHQERGRNEVDKKALVAEGMVQAWEYKSTDAASRRQQQKTANSEEFFRKHEIQAEAFTEFQQQKQQDVEDRAALFSQTQESVLSTGRRLMEHNERDWRSKTEGKATTSRAKNLRKLEAFDNRSASSKHAGELQAVLARRDILDKEFRNQATAEIDGKLARSASALRKVRKPPDQMDALQTRRPQSSTASRGPPALTLPPEMVPPSGIFALSACSPSGSPKNAMNSAFSLAAAASPAAASSSSNKQIHEADEFLAASDSVPSLPATSQQGRGRIQTDNASPEDSPMLSPAGSAGTRPQSSTGGRGRRVSSSSEMYNRARADSRIGSSRRMSIKAIPISIPDFVKRQAEAAQQKQDNLIGSDCSDDDEELLQDLEARSCKWLSEARRKAREIL